MNKWQRERAVMDELVRRKRVKSARTQILANGGYRAWATSSVRADEGGLRGIGPVRSFARSNKSLVVAVC